MDPIHPPTPKSSLTEVSAFEDGRTAERLKDWEIMFDPMYALPPTATRSKHRRKKHSNDDHEQDPTAAAAAHGKTTTPFGSIVMAQSQPTLPFTDHLMHQHHEHANEIGILPCPSSSFFVQSNTMPPHGHASSDRRRQMLLGHLRTQGFDPHLDRFAGATTTDSKTKKQQLLASMQEKEHSDNELGCQQQQKPSSSMMISRLPQPDKSKTRYYFYFGFVFPPLWILGAFQNKDLATKKRSRTAVFVFLVLGLILVLVLNPAFIGFRYSASAGQQQQQQR